MINLIAAIDLNNGLGYKNELLCHLSNDLKHFKNLTSGHFVCMGRLTYDSIGNPLPNRTNIILTRNKDYKAPLGTFVYHSIEDVISEYNNLNNNESELFIIGGGDIFKQAMSYADRIYLTIIQNKFSHVDSYFPLIDLSEWQVVQGQTVHNKADSNNEYDHVFVTYEKRKKD